jgi:protein TonB
MRFLILCLVLIIAAGPVSSFAQTIKPDTTVKSIYVGNLDSSGIKIEIESEFPGGTPAWRKFLAEHLTYPAKAVRKKIEGEVILAFIVEKDSSITDIKTVTGNPILAQAALEVMQQSPRWIPAKENFKPVKSYKKQPFTFRFER